jgi:antitoxin component of RelBE/YafQ-DinJ toxin-antitoxin module
MSTETEIIEVIVPLNLKESVEKVFKGLGFTIEEAVILYFEQTVLEQRIPLFEHDAQTQRRIAEFNRELELGYEDIKAGRVKDGETVMNELIKRFE